MLLADEPRCFGEKSVFMDTDPRYFKSEVPVGVSGEWVIEKVVVPERGYDPKEDRRPACFRFRPGRYTCLRTTSEVFMTDRYDEWWTQRNAVREACRRGGHVLITGLGLGMVVEAICRTPACLVGRITVLESAPDVIRLVAPYLHTRYGDRLEIVQGDVFAWTPPEDAHYSVVWHDIWANPEAPNVVREMDLLERRYAPFCDWQGSWPRDYIAALSEGREGGTSNALARVQP